MASMMKNNGKPMAEDESNDRGEEDERDEREERDDKEEALPNRGPAPTEAAKRPAALFTIYKSGQGYWTRMGTAAGGGLIVLATAIWLYQNLPVWSDYLRDHRSVLIGLLVALIAAMSILIFWVVNKPRNADFLIATDSEMKKVNWTTKADLIGSTKVVIFFVIMVTGLLFLVDAEFAWLFNRLNVMKTPGPIPGTWLMGINLVLAACGLFMWSKARNAR